MGSAKTLDAPRACARTRRERFRSACSVMIDTISMPAAKAVQLYGINAIPGPARFSTRSERFVESHPVLGKFAIVYGWAPIGFGLAKLGECISSVLNTLGGAISNSIGYTFAYTHPSLITLAIKKMFGVKNGKTSTSRYLEATAIADIPALPVYIATLSAVAYSALSSTISIGRAVASIAVASAVGLFIWGVGLVGYWTKIVHGGSNKNESNKLNGFLRGLGSAFAPWKRSVAKSDIEEAGAILGTDFMLWLPLVAVRCVVAAMIAQKDIEPAAFPPIFFSVMGSIDGLRVILGSIKISIVESIIARRNDAVHPD